MNDFKIGEFIEVGKGDYRIHGIVSFLVDPDEDKSEDWIEIVSKEGTSGPFHYTECKRVDKKEVSTDLFTKIQERFVILRLRQMLQVSQELSTGKMTKENLDFIAETKQALIFLGISTY
jgi:hypothetical protein